MSKLYGFKCTPCNQIWYTLKRVSEESHLCPVCGEFMSEAQSIIGLITIEYKHLLKKTGGASTSQNP